MPFISPSPISPIRAKQGSRKFTNLQPVRGADGNPAAGRTILAIGKSVFGVYEIKGQTITDSNGNYILTIAGAGPNDRYILVAIGNNFVAEYTKALGNMTGVLV